jgi:hypothetical protein
VALLKNEILKSIPESIQHDYKRIVKLIDKILEENYDGKKYVVCLPGNEGMPPRMQLEVKKHYEAAGWKINKISYSFIHFS